MSRLNRRRSRVGRRRGALLACVLLAATALAAIDAAGASALGKQCSGSEIVGEGAHLQELAQSIWTGSKEAGFNGSGAESACHGSQGSGGKPKVTFWGYGSGGALALWGADDGKLHTEGRSFLATDEPPAGPAAELGTVLHKMKAALGSDLVVAPVTQTAIAILANPPQLPAHSPCVVGQITQSDLEAVFSGQLTNWRLLTTASDQEPGGDCDQAITRAVRNDRSGVTYQFKHYLYELDPEPLACTGPSPKTWAQMQSSREPGELNRTWPQKSDCQEGEGPVSVVTAPKFSPLEFVASNHGTITFDDLPTAEQQAPESIIKVGNGVNLVAPASGSEANCGSTAYALPVGWETGLSVDWSGVYGSNPEIGKEAEGAYPLCTLTWDLTASNAGGVFGENAGTTVRDYLRYVEDPEGGVNDLIGHWYSSLPANVSEAAAAALAQIGGEGEEEEGGGGKTGTVLCKAAPKSEAGVLHCPSGEAWAGKVLGQMMPESEAVFESTSGPAGTISCTNAFLSGVFDSDGTSAPEGGVYNLEFNGSEGPCSATGELPEAKVRFSNAPYEASKFVYLGTLAPQGGFVLARSGGGGLELFVSATGVECVYTPTFLSGQVINGSPTELVTQGSWSRIEGGEEACPGGLRQAANLSLTRAGEGGDVYVAGE